VDGGLSRKKTPASRLNKMADMATPEDGSLVELRRNMAKSMAGFLEKLKSPPYFFSPCFST
jgi:hypothetical protein